MIKQLMQFSQKFFRTELVQGSTYIMIGSTAASFLAFAFTIFLARKLTSTELGIYSALISFSGLATIPSQSLVTSIIQYATPHLAKKEIKKAAYIYSFCTRYLLFVSMAIFLIFISFSGVIAGFLNISNMSYLWIMSLLIALSYFSVVNIAFLQSLLKFSFIAQIGFIGNISKLLFGISIILLGFHVAGALGAVIIAGIVPMLLAFYPLRFLLKSKKEKVSISKKDIFSYAVSVSIITLSLTSFTSSDIILVKHFFTPHEAGLYAGLSLVGKIIFYFTAPISTVLFPLILKKYSQGENFIRTFYLALLLILIPSLLLTILYFLFPKFILTTILGGKEYLKLAPYLWLFGLYLSIFSLLNITVTFALSLKKTKIIYPMVAGALLQLLSIYFFHANFFQVIFSSLTISSILLCSFLLYYVKNYGSARKQKVVPPIINTTHL